MIRRLVRLAQGGDPGNPEPQEGKEYEQQDEGLLAGCIHAEQYVWPEEEGRWLKWSVRDGLFIY